MANYIALREALCTALKASVGVPVCTHTGSFSKRDIEKLTLHDGDELLVAMEGSSGGVFRFDIYVKTQNTYGYRADERALGLILHIERFLHDWKHELIAKRINTTWDALPDSALAYINVYMYRVNASIPIYMEDYMENNDGD